ncbi:MAG: hypothetical protein K8R02_01490 [Anaerohalosphaeraceae bacterium]|nr:hypothetical protein [Anaerohalosphaeraceae bacterium]
MKKKKTIAVILTLAIIVVIGFVVNQNVYDFVGPIRNSVGKVFSSEDTTDANDSDGGAAPVDSNAAAKVEESKDSNAPADSNKPADANDANSPADTNAPADANSLEDPNDPLEALNLKNVEMKNIIQKLADWTGKIIIPDDEAMKQKITIYSTKELPRSQALGLIYSALRAKGFTAEYSGDAIYLKPVKGARLGSVPIVSADEPLAAIENKSQIVQKLFALKNYSSIQMSEIIMPLIGEYGYVSADENTGKLLVIDTVENLMRFERIIAQFDVPDSEKAAERIFEIRYGDPAEIVQLLRKLLAISKNDRLGKGSGSSKGKEQDQPESVIIQSKKTPIVLIPEPRRKWIVARADAEDMETIARWIKKLDQTEQVESEYETIAITYVDVREVAQKLNEAMQRMPGSELRTSVLVQPLMQARQIMVFGRAEMREMLKKLIAEIDVPTGKFDTRVFKLKYADAEQVKTNIDQLYGEQNTGGRRSYWSRGRRQSDADTVKAIAFPTMQQVTVIASAENIEKIAGQIAEWDVPLDVTKVKPVIIELQNSDPVRMSDLLTKLFTEEDSSSSTPWWMWWANNDDQKKKIVGALYGQLTFEPVPDTKKIIVISKITEAYDVIRELVSELDSMEVAELPMVVTLNYADAEDLCDQLNAILNEPGTVSTLRRSKRGLSEYSIDEQGNKQSGVSQTGSQDNANIITPWWDRSRNRFEDEMPTSNLIGRIRFIPVHRSKAILVLAPREYQKSLREMIAQLDQPGKQVMVKAIIIEVNHEKMDSLGVKLASDPGAFGALGEGALMALTQLAYTQTQGSFNVGDTGYKEGATTTANINILVDLLIQETNAKVLNQPTLWTKDNEEAEFFKGKRVPFLVSTQTSTEGTAQRDSVEYRDVGVTLRVRPNITPEKAVDMTVNLIISEVEQALVNGNIATSELNTTTNMIVADGETIMLGGILFKNDNLIEQKIPIFGDIPLIGPLFRHYDTKLSNNELIAFVTPYVIDADSSDATIRQIQKKRQTLNEVLELLDEDIEVPAPMTLTVSKDAYTVDEPAETEPETIEYIELLK